MSRLLEDAAQLAESGVRNPDGPAVRAALITLHTAWETYVEALVGEAARALLADPSLKPTQLSGRLRSEIAKAKNPWDLAGDGWKDLADQHVRREVQALNSPNAQKVNDLFNLALGLPDAVERCAWQNMPAARVVECLNEFVSIRGEVVHTGRTPGPLNVRGMRSWCEWITKLADRLDAVVAEHLASAHQVALTSC